MKLTYHCCTCSHVLLAHTITTGGHRNLMRQFPHSSFSLTPPYHVSTVALVVNMAAENVAGMQVQYQFPQSIRLDRMYWDVG